MKRFLTIIKFIAIAGICVVFILLLFPLENGNSLKHAVADSLNAYPSVCLGGWENPGNAAGAPDVSPGTNAFSNNNSAVLDQTQAQIFCGSFQASDQSQQPSSVTLSFSWNVSFPDDAPPPASSTDSDDETWSGVLDMTSTVSSTPPSTSEVSSTPPATSSTSTQSTSVASTSSPGVASTSQDQTQDSASAPTSTPAPTPTPTTTQDSAATPDSSSTVTAAGSSTSFLQNIMNDSLGFLIQKTFADTTDATDTTMTAMSDTSTTVSGANTTTTATTTELIAASPDDFVDVSYSLDGTTWQDLGQVSESDWQNFSVTIPVSSWSDINKLQVQISPLLSSDPPTIYLDGMWLQVNYNQSILGMIQTGATDALTDLSNTVNNALDGATNALSDLLSPDTTPPPDTTDTNTPPAIASAPTPPPSPQHQYLFALQSAESINVGKLSWAPATVAASGSAGGAGAGAGSAPTVSLPGTDTIQISGSCSEAYYTILLFANQDDYKNNPSLALLNEASPCVNGSFSQTISDMDLPPQLASGTYYLMVANQGKKGPWQPDPELYPIQLSGVSNDASTTSQ